jgi:hypothetical protein
MANVLRIYEVPDGLTGGLSLADQSGGRYTRVFYVEFDSTNASVWAAIAATNSSGNTPDDETDHVPSYGEQHPEDSTALVMHKTGDPLPDDPATWKVLVHYSYPQVDANAGSSPPAPSHPENGQNSGSPPQPLPNTRRDKGTFYRQKAWEKDLDGNLIKNTAGDPFDPPIVTDEPLSEYTFTRSQLTFDIGWSQDFEGAVNDRQYVLWFRGTAIVCPARTLKCAKITAAEVPATDNTPAYYTVAIVVQEDPQGWQPQPLNRGWRELVGGNLRPMLDGGMKPAQPPLLAANGARLAVGANPVFTGPWKVHKEKDFRWLALGD